MYNFDDNSPEWANEDADWAFSKNTVNQLLQIAKQLTEQKYNIESSIQFNREVRDDAPLKQYQDAIAGLVMMAQSEKDKYGFVKKVIIKTDVSKDAIMIQAGFDGSVTELWNNGVLYDEIFTKEELGKFSIFWERLCVNLLCNDFVVPITGPNNHPIEVEDALQLFIKSGLENGYIKKMR